MISKVLEGRRDKDTRHDHSELRDTEQVPLLEDGGIGAFIRREVLPHAPDADLQSRLLDQSADFVEYLLDRIFQTNNAVFLN